MRLRVSKAVNPLRRTCRPRAGLKAVSAVDGVDGVDGVGGMNVMAVMDVMSLGPNRPPG